MESNRSHLVRPPFIMLMVSISLSLALVASAAQVHVAVAEEQAASSTTASARYSGRDLFRALFLLEGPLVRLFPDLETARAEGIQRANDAGYEVNNDPDEVSFRPVLYLLEADHPGYLDRFATEVQSGDHVRVRAALDEGNDIIRPVILKHAEQEYGMTSQEFSDLEASMLTELGNPDAPSAVTRQESAQGTVVAVVVVAVLAVALVAWGGVAVTLAAYNAVEVVNGGVPNALTSSNTRIRLDRDQFIDLVTTRLAP